MALKIGVFDSLSKTILVDFRPSGLVLALEALTGASVGIFPKLAKLRTKICENRKIIILQFIYLKLKYLLKISVKSCEKSRIS